MNFRNFGFLLVLPFLASPLHAETILKDGKPRYVEANLIPEFNTVTSGQTLHFALTQDHADGWHTYWKNPGDSGETTSIEWTFPKGFQENDILYPAPDKQPTGPLMNFGFSGQTILLTSITAPENLKKSTDPLLISAKVSWLACHDICVPEVKEFSFTLNITDQESPSNNPALFETVRKSIPALKSWQGMIEEKHQSIFIKFDVGDEIKKFEGATDYFFFPEEWGIIQNAAAQTVSIHENQLIIDIMRDTRALSEIETLNGVLTYRDITGARQSVALSIPVTPTTVATENSQAERPSVQAEETSFAQAIFLALMGGLILNLMPCVFPVLSMKALSLVKMSEREQKHANLHGIFYTLGILSCFGGIAGLLIALQSAGQQIGWGFQLQNPIVILLLAYLLFIMALNLSGFFEIKSGPLANIGHKLASKHGYKGTFFTGVLATIVATPCTAPFMATAMGYALTQSALISLSIFMALGLGLALPYLVLCFIPALRKSLPKPGAWMETFRQFMSFPLFLSVAWLIWVYAQQVDGGYGVLLGLSGLIFIAFSIWISRHEPQRQPWKTAVHSLSISSIILALLIAAFSHTNMSSSKTDLSQTIPHTPYTKENFDTLLSGNNPIFVDMTAAWCITCKVNERIAINTDETQALFKSKNVELVIGDWTNQNPEITNYLASYGRNGVPLYVFYGARDTQTGQRPEPQILPQLLTSGLIADVINGEE
jgi:thiol:disulfide interchange protein